MINEDFDGEVMSIDLLVGKKVLSVELSNEDRQINFVTDNGNLKFYTYGDCCSESWIESIEDMDNLINEMVLSVNYKEKYKSLTGGPQECTDVYNYDIVTRKGVCTIEFRNSSNGYYGGWLELIK